MGAMPTLAAGMIGRDSRIDMLAASLRSLSKHNTHACIVLAENRAYAESAGQPWNGQCGGSGSAGQMAGISAPFPAECG
jgi:hypothetical protein